MKLIVDTHPLIWFIDGNSNLPANAIELIYNSKNKVYISKASLWEMAIKISLGKLKISIDFEDLEGFIENHGFEILDFNFSHLKVLLGLPYHHSDPFDRMIIAK